MTLHPMPHVVIVEIITQLEHEQSELSRKIPGFERAKSDKDIQGPPNMGKVYAAQPVVMREHGIKLGDTVIFKEDKPKGFEWENKKLLAIRPDQIMGVIYE